MKRLNSFRCEQHLLAAKQSLEKAASECCEETEHIKTVFQHILYLVVKIDDVIEETKQEQEV